MEMALGVVVVAAAGLITGVGVWPIKVIRTFQFEHWFFVGNLTGLIIMPWTITLVAFPHVFEAYRDVPASALVASNLCAIGWGVANVLCGLCLVRIGVTLSTAIPAGLGASVAVLLPMVFKGPGLFKDAPNIVSLAGLGMLTGIGVMLIGVVLASMAGFGRHEELKTLRQPSGSFLVGLIMAIMTGILSAGLTLAFVYSQGPIVSRVSMLESGTIVKLSVAGDKSLTGSYPIASDGTIAIKDVGTVHVAGISAKAAADRIAGVLNLPQQPEADAKVRVETANILAAFSVWAVGLLGGAMVNILYPICLMTKNKSWNALTTNGKELGLSIIMGLQFSVAMVLLGKGMVLLGALGASVGAGILQATYVVGGQGLGFISGEWHGVHGRPRLQMYLAIAVLIIATLVMAYSNTLS